MMGEDLKPCPFCGSANVRLDFHSPHWDVTCWDCKSGMTNAIAFGPEGSTPEKAIAAWNARAEPADQNPRYMPCPRCGQYSHSLGDDALAEAFLHFHTMISHRGDGLPTQDAFDDRTREMAQRLIAAARGGAAGWQPIETAPAAQGIEQDRILVVGGIYSKPEAVLPDGDWWRKRKAEGGKVFTHWMPLPAAPGREER